MYKICSKEFYSFKAIYQAKYNILKTRIDIKAMWIS